jgi:hypothetical protein
MEGDGANGHPSCIHVWRRYNLFAAVGVGVGVGLGASTTLKFTVIGAPLVPVPPIKLHGVATNVWVPIAVGVQVESKGVAESVFTPTPSLLNTTLRVLALACAVAV